MPPALDGERLDRALALITGLSRREVNAVLDAGRVRIGRRPVGSRSRRMHAGETIRVDGPLEPDRPAAPAADPTVAVAVVDQDDSIVVVDKPPGLVVHPGAGQRAATLVNGLLARYPDLAGVGDVDRPGIVHRLDKGTSGLLVVARTEAARVDLVRQLAERRMGREYLALVAGDLDSDEGLIDAPLGRSDTDPTRIRVQAGGRAARTRYTVVERFDGATLLRCQLETGRTHQVRVHVSSIGHPVVGDDRYAGRSVRFRGLLPPGRHFLHAAALELDHPVSGERRHFSSSLPDDLERVLSLVGGGGGAR